MNCRAMPLVAVAGALFFFVVPPTCAQSRTSSDIRQSAFTVEAGSIPSESLVQPEELAKTLQASRGGKPTIIQVGSHVLYQQAHIPGSEYVGPASSPAGLDRLRQRLQALPRKSAIVLYCGCCPWSHCPNVKPAWQLVQSMGFTNVKVLYIANNFGADWVDKGFPTAKD
jgi:thiosulfate/3-mercaptopyruvate sulfurtransferase